MDIKDFILIAGGMLIAAVVAHGFWIAWRNRAEPLRLDIVPDLLTGGESDGDLNRFRGELPNGGGRRVPPQQGDLLESALADVSAPDEEYAGVPVLLEPGVSSPRAEADRELLGTDVPARQRYERARDPRPDEQDLFGAGKPDPDLVGPDPVVQDPVVQDPVVPDAVANNPVVTKATPSVSAQPPTIEPEPAPARVAEVVLPSTPIVGEPRQPSANDPLPEVMTTTGNAEEVANAKQKLRAQRQSAVGTMAPQRRLSARESAARDTVRGKVAEKAKAKAQEFQAAREAAKQAAAKKAAEEEAKRAAALALAEESAAKEAALLAEREAAQAARDAAPVDELIVLHLLAAPGTEYVGPALVELLRAQGLKFGAMNIFHRVDPMTKARNYSVANAVEPGVFDLADLENFRSRGLSFFLQLPGPEDPLATLDDMVHVVRTLAQELGGEVKDEGMSVLTGQTVAHLRQRISDHARKRLSRRA